MSTSKVVYSLYRCKSCTATSYKWIHGLPDGWGAIDVLTMRGDDPGETEEHVLCKNCYGVVIHGE